MTSPTFQLACDLIARPSVTPDDAGCQAMLIERLRGDRLRAAKPCSSKTSPTSGRGAAIADRCSPLPATPTWCRRDRWTGGTAIPFEPEVRDGVLYGRGAADMKSSIAAFVTACERFVEAHSEHRGSIALLITSDEEAAAINGTVKVIETLEARGEKIDWALIGEPSSTQQVGDVVKNGRRGSIGAKLVIHGVQGHVAYPHKVDNPIHRAMPALHELARHEWDRGNQFFPPTSFQISNINAGTGAHNVVPAHAEVIVQPALFDRNRRAAHHRDHARDSRQARTRLRYRLEDLGLPLPDARGRTGRRRAESAIREHTGISKPSLETTGGTSDGRFIAPTGAQVLELGPVNESIHKLNEHVDVAELDQLSDIYQSILENLLT